MKRVAELLNQMLEAGVVRDYAVFGAVAQMRYTEAVATFDADILVAVPEPDALDVLAPLYSTARSGDTARRAKPSGWVIGPSSSFQPADGRSPRGGGDC